MRNVSKYFGGESRICQTVWNNDFRKSIVFHLVVLVMDNVYEVGSTCGCFDSISKSTVGHAICVLHSININNQWFYI